MAREDYELVKALLKPPLRVLGITTEIEKPEKPQYDEQFNSLEEVYDFFRKKRPEGRWIIWVLSIDGQGMPLDSKEWEKAIKD